MSGKKTKERQYDEEAFKNAVIAVRSGHITSGKAAKLYGIPKTTLWLHAKMLTDNNDPVLRKLGTRFLLDKEEETSLAVYMKWCEDASIPFTYELLKMFANQILNLRGVKRKVCHNWARSFLARNTFKPKKPRQIPRAREAAYSNAENILHYFDLLQSHLTDKSLADKPHLIWNVDEKGWSKEQSIRRPVLCSIGHRQAKTKQIFLNEHITTVHCINACGAVQAPYVVFNRNIPNSIDVTSLPDSWNFGRSESGFLNSELFFMWFKNSFIPNIGRERPQLLLYDAASCHISLSIVQLAIKENISILTLPGKSTAFLQPVDQILSNLESAFAELAFNMSFTKADFLVRPGNFAPVLHQALQKAWTKQLVENAFKRTGIFPPSLTEISKSIQLTDECRATIVARCSDKEADEDTVLEEVSSSSDIAAPCFNQVNNISDSEIDPPHICECGRPIEDPCLPCIRRYKMKHNPLFRSGAIPERLSDILDATNQQKQGGHNNLTKAQFISVPDVRHLLEERQQKKIERELKRAENERKKQEKQSQKEAATAQENDLPDIRPPKKRKRRACFVPPLKHIEMPKEIIDASHEEQTSEALLTRDTLPSAVVQIDNISTSFEHTLDNDMRNLLDDLTKDHDTSAVQTPSTSATRKSTRTKVPRDYAVMNNGDNVDVLDDQATKCPRCHMRYDETDEMLGVLWYGCDMCPKWWHRHCLTTELQAKADISCIDTSEKFQCPCCVTQKLCSSCMLSGETGFIQCHNCLNFHHLDCLPDIYREEYTRYQTMEKSWYCYQCENES